MEDKATSLPTHLAPLGIHLDRDDHGGVHYGAATQISLFGIGPAGKIFASVTKGPAGLGTWPAVRKYGVRNLRMRKSFPSRAIP